MTSDERVQYKLLLPADLKARLEALAHDNRRSLSAEITDRLENSLERLEDELLPSAFYGLLTQLQASVDGADSLFRDLWIAVRENGLVPKYLTQDMEDHIANFATERSISREEAIRELLKIALKSVSASK